MIYHLNFFLLKHAETLRMVRAIFNSELFSKVIKPLVTRRSKWEISVEKIMLFYVIFSVILNVFKKHLGDSENTCKSI